MLGRERLRENDRELIAAEASGRVAGPDRLLDPLADLLEHLVAEVVAPPVVDRLEVVEVDVEQTGRLALLMPELDRVTEALVEEGAVGEAGQRVVEGLLPQLQLGLALARDVEEVALQVERLPVVVEDDDPFVAKPDDSAAAGDQAVLDAERLVRLMRVRMGGEHALAVVLVEQAREQVGVGLPLLHAVAEEGLDLWAREDVGADRVECVDVDDERELLDQRAIAAADLPRGQVVVALAERKRRRRHHHGIGHFAGMAPPPDGVSNVVRAPRGALTSVLRAGASVLAQVPAGTFEGSGTIRMYGFGSSHSPNSSFASSFETEPAMITSSPCCHWAGVDTL